MRNLMFPTFIVVALLSVGGFVQAQDCKKSVLVIGDSNSSDPAPFGTTLQKELNDTAKFNINCISRVAAIGARTTSFLDKTNEPQSEIKYCASNRYGVTWKDYVPSKSLEMPHQSKKIPCLSSLLGRVPKAKEGKNLVVVALGINDVGPDPCLYTRENHGNVAFHCSAAGYAADLASDKKHWKRNIDKMLEAVKGNDCVWIGPADVNIAKTDEEFKKGWSGRRVREYTDMLVNESKGKCKVFRSSEALGDAGPNRHGLHFAGPAGTQWAKAALSCIGGSSAKTCITQDSFLDATLRETEDNERAGGAAGNYGHRTAH